MNDISTPETPNPLEDKSWLRKWREICAFVFIAVVCFDFIIAPSVHPWVCFYLHFPYQPWIPMTLGAGGTFFISFGAILGIAAFGRSQENTEMIKNMPDYSAYPVAKINNYPPYQPQQGPPNGNDPNQNGQAPVIHHHTLQ